MNFKLWLEERKKGKSLKELGFDDKVVIFRAVSAKEDYFKSMDYVTKNLRFARIHAEHMAVTEEENYQVISVSADPRNVFEAPNPGEYYYDGPKLKGHRVYIADYKEEKPW